MAFASSDCCCGLKGIHNPLLDHPGWRQGDTGAIAAQFRTAELNIFFPQTEYNGAPPNYVELELQIVPFLAAIGYTLFGVHEVFGRLIAIGFGIGTIVVVGFFARWLFSSAVAGIAAMAIYTIVPGAHLLFADVPARRRDGVLFWSPGSTRGRVGSCTTAAVRGAAA